MLIYTFPSKTQDNIHCSFFIPILFSSQPSNIDYDKNTVYLKLIHGALLLSGDLNLRFHNSNLIVLTTSPISIRFH